MKLYYPFLSTLENSANFSSQNVNFLPLTSNTHEQFFRFSFVKKKLHIEAFSVFLIPENK